MLSGVEHDVTTGVFEAVELAATDTVLDICCEIDKVLDVGCEPERALDVGCELDGLLELPTPALE